ncbi:hypothetical protein GCM10027037_05710 [Mucilaginibacter koreensis]
MQYNISFTQVTNAEFKKLTNTFSFNLLSSSTSVNGDGEKAFAGIADTGDTCMLFEYFDLTDKANFLISANGKLVQYTFTEAASPETIQALIRGSITKYCLQQQGYFCLHTAGIRINNKIILFLGRKGAGKSTLSAYFSLQGWPVWCDDYGVLVQHLNGFDVEQGEQLLKVTEATVAALQLPANQLKSVFTYADNYAPHTPDRHMDGKYYFGSNDNMQSHKPLPLAAVYLLQPREHAPQHLLGRPLSGSAFTLLMNEIMLPGLNSKKYLQLYFNSVKTLLDHVPIYAVYAPDDITRINEVYQAVLNTVITHNEPAC